MGKLIKSFSFLSCNITYGESLAMFFDEEPELFLFMIFSLSLDILNMLLIT